MKSEPMKIPRCDATQPHASKTYRFHFLLKIKTELECLEVAQPTGWWALIFPAQKNFGHVRLFINLKTTSVKYKL